MSNKESNKESVTSQNQDDLGLHDGKACCVCGDRGSIGFYRGDYSREWLCAYCMQWFAASSLQTGGPTWGRDQVHRLPIIPAPGWLGRARVADFPDAPLLRILKELKEGRDAQWEKINFQFRTEIATPFDSDR